MTKAELVRNIAANTVLDRNSVMEVIENFMAEVKTSLNQRENVYLRGFGTFEVKHRASKPGRNIRQGTSMMVPEKDVPAFRPSRDFTIGEV